MNARKSSALDIADLGARAEAMIAALGAISAEPSRLVRLFLTPEHRRAADLVATWMRDAGLDMREDALGTVRGVLAGNARPRLLIGSHIDTVVDAGQYDGVFGVVAGILAAQHFAARNERLPFGIEVLAFGDEEGSRYASTLTSSRAIAGVLDADDVAQADRDGITLAEAIRAYGKNPNEIAAAAVPRVDALAYVEVHIEQGPALEAAGQPLGIVTAIAGQTYFSVELTGEAGHAGTVPPGLRRDALAGAAELIQFAESLAHEHGEGVVATVGRLNVMPNASNVIPGHVAFTLDLRTTSDVTREAIAMRFADRARAVAQRRRLDLVLTQTRDTTTTPCDPRLQNVLAEAAKAVGCDAPRLGSGAGHDGQAMAQLCPVGMLFVRCRGGISHNPAEYASPHDMGLAVATLIEFIGRLDPAGFHKPQI